LSAPTGVMNAGTWEFEYPLPSNVEYYGSLDVTPAHAPGGGGFPTVTAFYFTALKKGKGKVNFAKSGTTRTITVTVTPAPVV